MLFENEKNIKLNFDQLFVQEFKELPSEDLKEYCCVNQRNLVEILKEYKGYAIQNNILNFYGMAF